ncbi:MAG: PIN domain-containing protein [Candidatus Dormiibacterota bacterium]
MTRLLYADSGAFIALLYRRDHDHERVSAHLRRLRQTGDVLVTCEAVISETVTRLRYDAGLDATRRFRRVLTAGAALGSLEVRESDEGLRQAAFDVLAQYGDLRLSYADAMGAAIARERRVDAVFGLDNDFRVMGFQLEPA